jgi:hypothetical protein
MGYVENCGPVITRLTQTTEPQNELEHRRLCAMILPLSELSFPLLVQELSHLYKDQSKSATREYRGSTGSLSQIR